VPSVIRLGAVFGAEPPVQLLVEASRGVLGPGGVLEAGRRLDYVVVGAVAADALVRVVGRHDVHLFAAVQTVHLVVGGMAAGVAVEHAVAAGADGT
jgi:hypothetical protein